MLAAFQSAIEREGSGRSRLALTATLGSLNCSRERENLACPDTGWPLFFCKIGNDAKIEGGLLALEDVCRRMVALATQVGYLRSTMKHPFTGDDPGTNIGENIPNFSYKIIPGNTIQITFVPKGSGSECFGGTRYRVVAFADGLVGIKKFVIDSFVAVSRAGAICPPPVVGIGIGGTADMAAALAKKAACLRLIGSRHPESSIAGMEEELLQGLNCLGIGAMGCGGTTSAFAVNIEYAYTHIAGIAVAMSCNCMVTKRATTKIHADGKTEDVNDPDWFDRR